MKTHPKVVVRLALALAALALAAMVGPRPAHGQTAVQAWVQRYNGPGNSGDFANAVAVDGSGNVFVTGLSIGSGNSFDYATIKYSGAGVALWTNRYNGPGNNDDEAHAMAVDGSGNVFVTGRSIASGSLYDDYATIAYSGAGVAFVDQSLQRAGQWKRLSVGETIARARPGWQRVCDRRFGRRL